MDPAAPNTFTGALRLAAMTVFTLTFAAVVLQLISVGVDEIVTFSLPHSTRVDWTLVGGSPQRPSLSSSSSSFTALPPSSAAVQLIPQIDIAIGFTQACFGAQCVSRSTVPGILPLVHDAHTRVVGLGGLRPASLQAAYDHFARQFTAGHSINAQLCPQLPEEANTAALAKLGVAAGSLAVVFLCASILLAGCLAFLLARINVVPRHNGLYTDADSETVVFGPHQVSLEYLRTEIDAHTRLEGPVMLSLFPCLFGAVLCTLCTVALGASLYQTKLRCGRPLCHAYVDAAKHFFTLLAESLGEDRVDRRVSCARGVSLATGATAFALTTTAFLVYASMLALYCKSQRRQTLVRRKDAVDRLSVELGHAKEGERVWPHAGAARPAFPVPSKQGGSPPPLVEGSAAIDNECSRGDAALAVEAAASSLERHTDSTDFSNPMESPLSPINANHRERGASSYRVQQPERELAAGMENTLGGRIAFLRKRRRLMDEEAKDRVHIERGEGHEFLSLQKQQARSLARESSTAATHKRSH